MGNNLETALELEEEFIPSEGLVLIEGRDSDKDSEHMEAILPFKGYFERRTEYTKYLQHCKRYLLELIEKRRTCGFNGKWNALGIDFERIYYQTGVLIVEPVFPQDGVDFRKDYFASELKSHLDLISEKFGRKNISYINFRTGREGVRTPFVSIPLARGIKDKAFLSVYFHVLKEDRVNDRHVGL